jgi:hypothetical protein
VAVGSAKSNARRLREQDGGTLDLHRQSLRQHGLLSDRHSVVETPVIEGVEVETGSAGTTEEAVRAESRRRKEEAKVRETEELKRLQEERNSWWNWIRGR